MDERLDEIDTRKDKRAPRAIKESVRKSMRGNKSKHTLPELLLRKMLFSRGVRGYRLHWKIAGNPDLAFVGKKIGIFIHGCFWHRCPHCKLPVPKRNTAFWEEKFYKNMRRDERNKQAASKLGWKSLIIWECELKKNPAFMIKKILKAISKEPKIL